MNKIIAFDDQPTLCAQVCLFGGQRGELAGFKLLLTSSKVAFRKGNKKKGGGEFHLFNNSTLFAQDMNSCCLALQFYRQAKKTFDLPKPQFEAMLDGRYPRRRGPSSWDPKTFTMGACLVLSLGLNYRLFTNSASFRTEAVKCHSAEQRYDGGERCHKTALIVIRREGGPT